MKRYRVIAGSQSGHCCFDATVVDTTKPIPQSDRFEEVCECFEVEQATLIANALNLVESL
jgi:hypothetical protein